jgi:hypothetical protein
MTPDEPERDPVDELVGRFLASQEAGACPEAFLARLRRRQARRRVVRLVGRYAAVAAAAAVVAIGLVTRHLPGAVAPAPRELDLLAMGEWQAPLSEELAAALEGAREVGTAVVSATEAPLHDLAAITVSVPDLPDLAGLLGLPQEAVPEPPKENQR